MAVWELDMSVLPAVSVEFGDYDYSGENPVYEKVEEKTLDTSHTGYGTIPTPTRSGYTLDSWYCGLTDTFYAGVTAVTYARNDSGVPAVTITYGGGTTDEIVSPTKLVLEAVWQTADNTITLYPNGGEVTGSSFAADGGVYTRAYTCLSGTITLPILTRTGYKFDGWYADAAFSGDAVTAVAANTTVLALSYYAKWEAVEAKAPTLTGPADLALAYGYTQGSLSASAAAAAGAEYTLSYQWYQAADTAGTTGTELTGATGVSYTIPAGKAAGTTEYYDCAVTTTRTDNAQAVTAKSGVATVTVSMLAQGAPQGVGATDETYEGEKNGTLTGVTTAMEYSTDGTTWTKITDTTVTGLPAGTYLVRYSADANHEAGGETAVTVAAGRKLAVTFKAEGSADSVAYTAWHGSVAFPAVPARAGYTGVWNPTAIEDNSIEADATVNAVYTAVVSRITLQNDGTNSPTAAIYDWYGSGFYLDEAHANQMRVSANRITVPAKTGYTFLGYFTGEKGTGTKCVSADGYLAADADSTLFAGDGTLYAAWSVDAYSYSIVSYDSSTALTAKVTVGGASKDASTIAYDRTNTVTITPKSGYLLHNIKVYVGGVETAKSIYEATTGAGLSGTQTISVNLSTDKIGVGGVVIAIDAGTSFHTVTYVTYGGVFTSTAVSAFPQLTGLAVLPTIEKTGYSFGGWCVDEACKYKVTAIPANTAKDVTLYAKWTANSYTVTFDAAGGSVGTPSKSVSFAETYGELPTPTRTGYAFAGWYDPAGAQVTAQTTVTLTADQTLTARWAANTNTAYAVRHIRQALDGTYPTDGNLVETEAKTGTTGQTTAAEARTYTGFAAGAVTQGTVAGDGSTVVEIKYARSSHKLTWNADGGSITSAAGSYTAGTVYYGAPITAPEATRAGYTFVEWNADDTMPDADTTYTAQWSENADVTVSYAAGTGGTVSKDQETLHPASGTAAGSTATAGAG